MYKTKYLFIAVVAVLSLILWGSRSFADDEWTAGTVQGYYQPTAWSTFEAGWLVGHKVYSPAGGELGQIADLIMDRSDGHIVFVILSDVPGFEDRYAAAPFRCLTRTGENTFNLNFGDREVSVPPSYQDALAGYYSSDPFAYEMERYASTIGLNRIPASIDTAWADGVYRFYGVTPYWTEGNRSYSDLMSYRDERMAYFFAPADTNGLIGAEVRSSDGATVARIEDLVIDANDGRVVLVVFDQVPGRADVLVAVPFGELSMSGNAFVFGAARDRLASAPEFRETDWANQRKVEDIYLFFGVQPYWTAGGGASMEEHHSDEMAPSMEEHHSEDMGTEGSSMEP